MGRPRVYQVHLTAEQKSQLHRLVHTGSGKARVLERARMLLLADADPEFDNGQIGIAVGRSRLAVGRTIKRFALEGLDAALYDKPRPGAAPKLDSEQAAVLVTLACSTPPEGHEHWTLRLLAARMGELQVVDELSYETVRRRLKKPS